MMSGLAALLVRESELVRGFIASLKSEQEALKDGSVDSLSAINANKLDLVEKLNAIEVERNAFLNNAGFSGDRSGMEALLAKSPRDQGLAKAWAGLMTLAAEARELNNLNGKLIAMRLQATNQALVSLTRQPHQRSGLYGRDGQTMPGTGSRIIDAA